MRYCGNGDIWHIVCCQVVPSSSQVHAISTADGVETENERSATVAAFVGESEMNGNFAEFFSAKTDYAPSLYNSLLQLDKGIVFFRFC